MDYSSPREAPHLQVNGAMDQEKELVFLGALSVWVTRPWRLEALVAVKRLALCADDEKDEEVHAEWVDGLVKFYANEPLQTLHLDTTAWQQLLRVDAFRCDGESLAAAIPALLQRAWQMYWTAAFLWQRAEAGVHWYRNLQASYQIVASLSNLHAWLQTWLHTWPCAPCCGPTLAPTETFEQLALSAFVDLDYPVPKSEQTLVYIAYI